MTYKKCEVNWYILNTLSIIRREGKFVKLYFQGLAELCGVTLKAEKTETVFLLYFFIKSAEGGLKMDGYSYLTFDQRREIEALYGEGIRTVEIAAKIGRSVAAIYEELKRGYTGELDENKRPVYSADLAQQTAQENIRRRGNRRAANQ